MQASYSTVCPMVAASLAAWAADSTRPPINPVVEVEETVYQYEDAKNGAGPTWCVGSTCLVRIGDDVFTSGLETLKQFEPLNNVRWLLFKREAEGWTLQRADPTGRTREPCPLACFRGGPLFMSVNPGVDIDPKKHGSAARPEILQFDASDLKAPFQTLLPEWQGSPDFREHSYRTFAANGANRELILFQNISTTHAEWAFLDREGKWHSGQLSWPKREDTSISPYGSDRARVNYPNVVLRDRAVYLVGSSAYNKWARVSAATPELIGRKWGSRWRVLHYTWTPDITKEPFRPWLRIANTFDNGGWLFNGDLWVAPNRDVHIVWFEHPLSWRLRVHFPDIDRLFSYKYARVRDGQIVERRALLQEHSNTAKRFPYRHGNPRLHVTPDSRLFAVYHVMANGPDNRVHENHLMELYPDGTQSQPVTLPLKHPFSRFFTATPRAGCAPSYTLDLLGSPTGRERTIGYARVRLR